MNAIASRSHWMRCNLLGSNPIRTSGKEDTSDRSAAMERAALRPRRGAWVAARSRRRAGGRGNRVQTAAMNAARRAGCVSHRSDTATAPRSRSASQARRQP